MRITTSIMIAKAIAAIALTASTAGGIALATRPRRPTHTPRTPSESAATTVDVPSSLPLTTPGPTDAARADAEEEAEKPPAAQPGEQRTGTRTGTAIRAAPGGQGPTSEGPVPGGVEHRDRRSSRQGRREPCL